MSFLEPQRDMSRAEYTLQYVICNILALLTVLTMIVASVLIFVFAALDGGFESRRVIVASLLTYPLLLPKFLLLTRLSGLEKRYGKNYLLRDSSKVAAVFVCEPGSYEMPSIGTLVTNRYPFSGMSFSFDGNIPLNDTLVILIERCGLFDLKFKFTLHLKSEPSTSIVLSPETNFEVKEFTGNGVKVRWKV